MTQRNSIEILIEQRLKLPTNKRKLESTFGIVAETSKDLFLPNHKKKILNFNENQMEDFIVTIAGKLNKIKAKRYINENII